MRRQCTKRRIVGTHPVQIAWGDARVCCGMAIRKPTRAPAKPPRRTDARSKKSVAQMIIDLGKSIPADELTRFPSDGARNLDHYLYGAPKEFR